MTTRETLPKLITFDGEARSGKGTIAHFIKRSLQSRGLNVMLIDRGQIFRSLVVGAEQAGVNMDDPTAIDRFLSDEARLEENVQLIKRIYAMEHAERDTLLYTAAVSVNSAKVGARPLSQDFAISLTKKWVHDANEENVDVILMDGRALQGLGEEMQTEGSCEYPLGLYFKCDPLVGARRTLGYAEISYDQLDEAARHEVDQFVAQINTRNQADMTRSSQAVVEPANAPRVNLPNIPRLPNENKPQMLIIDTSAELTKDIMSQPVLALVEQYL